MDGPACVGQRRPHGRGMLAAVPASPPPGRCTISAATTLAWSASHRAPPWNHSSCAARRRARVRTACRMQRRVRRSDYPQPAVFYRLRPRTGRRGVVIAWLSVRRLRKPAV